MTSGRGHAHRRPSEPARLTRTRWHSALVAALLVALMAATGTAQAQRPESPTPVEMSASNGPEAEEVRKAEEEKTPRLPTAATLRQMIQDLENAAAQNPQLNIPLAPADVADPARGFMPYLPTPWRATPDPAAELGELPSGTMPAVPGPSRGMGGTRPAIVMPPPASFLPRVGTPGPGSPIFSDPTGRRWGRP